MGYSEVHKEILKLWSALSEDLLKSKHITIPRHVKLHNSECIEIYGICDASEKAYGGAIYIRSISKSISQCDLLCAKTRVAPLKKTTKACLELCGAVTLIELLESGQSNLK